MAIYVKVAGINGSVSTKGYEKCFELLEIHLGFCRPVMIEGNSASRSTGFAKVTQLSANKITDASSSQLLSYLLGNKVIPEMKIFVCSTDGDQTTAHVTYTLSNVIVSELRDAVSSNNSLPLESLQLHFTRIQKAFYPKDSANHSSSPYIITYDLEKKAIV